MAQGRDPRWFVESKSNALQLPDVKTGFEVLRLLKLDGKGLKNLDDMKRVIIKRIDEGSSIEPPKEPSRGLQKAIEDDQQNKSRLLAKYENVHSFYQELPPRYQKDLCQVFQGIETEFVERKNEITKSECTILVAGETAAGKSSLINLLLGGVDLLPVSQLGCTTTICELRTTGPKGAKEAVCFYRSANDDSRKSKKAPPIVIDLADKRGIKKLHDAIQDCDEDGDSRYDRIEITYPFPMLEEGIVIVDTPGIGGSGNMARHAEKYLSKSYGFIYVINSANAGGVQKGRLQNFMRLVMNAAGEEGFNSEATIFVCNRWEMIPKNEQEAVKEDTLKKIAKYYRDLRKSQVHFMSILETNKAMEYKTLTPEYNSLMEMVEKLLPDSLRSRLNAHYRWLTAVLKRSIYSLKVSKVITAKSVEKVKEEHAMVKRQIERLEQNSRDSISLLKGSIFSESERVAKQAKDALRSLSVAQRLFDWRPQDCPTDDRKKVAGEALERIANRVAMEINIWERENKIVIGIKDSIIRVCKRDFDLMEGQIAKLEGALLDGDNRIVQDLHKSIKKQAPVKQLWKKAKESSIDEESGNSFKGLGGAIASLSTIKASDKPFKNIFKDYKLKDQQKSVQKMHDATKMFLESLMENKSFQDKVHTFFKRFTKGLDAVAQMIPGFLKADLQLIGDLRNELDDKELHLKDLLPKLIHRSHQLLGQLDLFFVNYIMVFDYSLSEISWHPQEPPVGSGSFADVFIAEILTASRKIPVALKVCRDPLKESTVTDILLEDRTLRELDHPNIVRYYGATYRFKDKGRRDMQWIMILEVCKYTLKQRFVSPEVDNPGKLAASSGPQVEAMLTLADFALQLCKGLKYIHEKGFVHRDLKLENILVTKQNQIKLTDVGLAKPMADIAFSIVGSPVYMAPEVLLQSQNYDFKADIYSLAIVLWEMWYGKDAADYIQSQLFGTLESAIKDGLRPSLKLSTKPPEHWIQLIEGSWAYDPDIRPSVDIHCRFFENFIKEAQRM